MYMINAICCYPLSTAFRSYRFSKFSQNMEKKKQMRNCITSPVFQHHRQQASLSPDCVPTIQELLTECRKIKSFKFP